MRDVSFAAMPFVFYLFADWSNFKKKILSTVESPCVGRQGPFMILVVLRYTFHPLSAYPDTHPLDRGDRGREARDSDMLL